MYDSVRPRGQVSASTLKHHLLYRSTHWPILSQTLKISIRSFIKKVKQWPVFFARIIEHIYVYYSLVKSQMWAFESIQWLLKADSCYFLFHPFNFSSFTFASFYRCQSSRSFLLANFSVVASGAKISLYYINALITVFATAGLLKHLIN